MTSLTDPPKESFRLGMLIYDTRYRSLTIQVVALIGFMIFAAWLINNTLVNLAVQGKSIGFGFLSDPAGYDINQRLLDYNSQSTHWRAAFVGLLNTLLVAFLGCITATVIGVLVGILRLSNNWLVARLMTIYVEMFRNVPVLLWIVFTMAILIETLPAPRAFRGENPEASMVLFDSVAFTNRGVYLPEALFSRGLGDMPIFPDRDSPACQPTEDGSVEDGCGVFQISLDLILILAVFGAGLYGSSVIRKRADRIQNQTGDRPTTWYLRLGVVSIPTLIVLAALGFHLGYPALKGFNFQGGTYLRNSLIALWLALSLYTAAFIAEIVRAGILAISKGQTEAASALGLRSNRIMSLVILPQALRVIIPPLISNYLNLTKNSSLAIAVGYMDITGTLGGITMNQTGRELECVLLLMLVYLAISLTISAVMNWYNESVKLVER
ncbi:L-glutamine ABC transporter membrane protein /L-glutamate ABC transporter membrane protein /L-aspartate ABC transporter membrane protein /L-asparagine ABC transporter membrane protein [Aliiruegeria haliotis]|uniref:L-glutamine ABC transporter membrane protein /L-glutamate ABC transporter membrane protein /L-aspartate ABC transporter membrane protein /L-asparagine ABC transporter membrane protein n=1 Tax=Aliiruegeria haliotis TaxID=1280846 RepID=A0A2T0RPG3_9RHOB|nr:ABC transporter permease subunit [Aliiruegeria haliotis]PRY22983.1 L-glutamine ABC transporter membrane protein /L-glutamate ABC transporter membrane protein /L-aspartate ABC transporter membrane protein /L-asparagine ABC transporter membrane protein [Aliiruegeria haliotis]